MSTILKWAGNKTAIMPELIKHLPAGPRLVEPFAGSCAVMMATDYPHYLVADINPDLINLYKQIAFDCDKFISNAKGFFASTNSAESYYNIRQDFNHSAETTDFWKAVFFLYLNRHGYRGLCRYNLSGHFNVPYGNYKKPYFPESEIRTFAEKSQRATFICTSYDETLALLQVGDVVYCDPPTKVRFCTFELKHEPVRTQVIVPALDEYDEVISWQGVRGQESPARALLPEWEEDADDTPGLHVYRPILNWLHEDVFAIAKRHGIKPNPLYLQGCSRVGCMPCIHARKSELAEIFQRWPEEIRRVAEWERMVAECSRRGNSTFFPSTHDPRRAEKRIEVITVDAYGIESYRDWALTTRGGAQFDLLAGMNDKAVCSSVYAGVCE